MTYIKTATMQISEQQLTWKTELKVVDALFTIAGRANTKPVGYAEVRGFFRVRSYPLYHLF